MSNISMTPKEYNTTDHDLLIRLDQKFQTFLDQYQVDIRNLNEGITNQLAQHEILIQTHDREIDELKRIVTVVKPEETTKDYFDFKKDMQDTVLRAATIANTYRLVAGAVGGLIVFILSQLPTWLEKWIGK